MKVVIVGNGTAGNQAAFRLRSKRPDLEISIVSGENCPEYDPCSLPYILSGQLPWPAVFKRSLEEYAKNSIDLVLGSQVTSIQPEASCIVTEDGREIEYDKLVLAHGGQLFMPPVDGLDKKGVFSLKQLADAEKLNAHQGRRAVVIGSGAIGIEAAEALKIKGFEVSIVELYDWVMPTMFDRETAALLKSQLEMHGIRVYIGEKVQAVLGKSCVESVTTDQRTIPCDTVVVATGVAPDVALPKTAGITVERGIKVNRKMQTSIADIYACGDCVETIDACTGEDVMFQLKHNAINQAIVAADSIVGINTVYPGAYAFARIHFFDTHAACFGKTTQSTMCELGELEILEKKEPDGYLRLILKEGLIAGVQAVGSLAADIGLFISMARRDANVNDLRKAWASAGCIAHSRPWTDRMIGQVLSAC
ncbi:MAG: NAD(P)/FAD-dependent oxidoreductase [Deltaproteobacteria bacterium]|nr:NAD(P)/FAD-dependent oxidoreductase [Deltaproteobacteria bacterium]MBW2678409.1 NAD(P)/FAD-dependent oxidoreductase [Deltaproteobacteria bacterium]